MKNEKKKENDVFDKIEAWMRTKISNEVLATLIMLIVGLLMVALSIGFLVLPFITYNSLALKIVFGIFWLISCVVIIFSGLDEFKKQSKEDKWGLGITIAGFIGFFAVCFINNNFHYLGKWWQIAIVSFMFLVAAMAIYQFIKELIKNPKGVLASLLMAVMLLIGILLILASSLETFELGFRKKILIVGVSCAALPIIALLIARLAKISKPEKVLEYASIVIMGIALLVGVSYVISFLSDSTINMGSVFVQFFAAFIGGGLTLLGVAWTIKDQEKIRKAEEKRKWKPYMTIYYAYAGEEISGMSVNSPRFLSDEHICLEHNTNDLNHETTIDDFILSNTEEAPFLIKGIKMNQYFLKMDVFAYIKKGENVCVSFDQKIIYTKDRISSMDMVIEDMLGNEYLLNFDFSITRTSIIEKVFSDKKTKTVGDDIYLDHQIDKINITDVKGLKEIEK